MTEDLADEINNEDLIPVSQPKSEKIGNELQKNQLKFKIPSYIFIGIGIILAIVFVAEYIEQETWVPEIVIIDRKVVDENTVLFILKNSGNVRNTFSAITVFYDKEPISKQQIFDKGEIHNGVRINPEDIQNFSYIVSTNENIYIGIVVSYGYSNYYTAEYGEIIRLENSRVILVENW